MKCVYLPVLLMIVSAVSGSSLSPQSSDDIRSSHVTFKATNVTIRKALGQLFQGKASFIVAPDVYGEIMVEYNDLPFETALEGILNQVNATYVLKGGVFVVSLKPREAEIRALYVLELVTDPKRCAEIDKRLDQHSKSVEQDPTPLAFDRSNSGLVLTQPTTSFICRVQRRLSLDSPLAPKVSYFEVRYRNDLEPEITVGATSQILLNVPWIPHKGDSSIVIVDTLYHNFVWRHQVIHEHD